MDNSTGTETDSPREATLRKLFGGAMECLLPAAFVDVRCGGSTCPRASDSSSECAAVLPNTELFVPDSASIRLGLVHKRRTTELRRLRIENGVVYERNTRVDK